MTSLTIVASTGHKAILSGLHDREADLYAAISREGDPGCRIRSYRWTPKPRPACLPTNIIPVDFLAAKCIRMFYGDGTDPMQEVTR